MYVIGTAGHVDHGKSTLVKALTGIDPDRLAEEKRREMTIDLGFAWFSLPSGRSVSVVDVPGHERFIKNMLAGVGGIDAALLVVAADEALMPQTLEHLAILDLLGVSHGVVVLTKIDLVEPDWLALVADEVHQQLRGMSLSNAPFVPVSARTGVGLAQLGTALDQVLDQVPSRSGATGAPRLAIDRAFTVGGFGTVVTGTLRDGPLLIGAEVEIQPSGLRARVRGLQSHNQKLEQALPGTRVAVNLAGVAHHALRRGDLLTLPGTVSPTTLLDVSIRLVADLERPLEQNAALELFVGAAEAACRATLLDREQLRAGEQGWLQLRLEQPIAVARGDRYIVRLPSPGQTVGGGQVIDAHPPRHRRFRSDVIAALTALARGTPADLLRRPLASGLPVAWPDLLRASGLGEAAAHEGLAELLAQHEALVLGANSPPTLISSAGWANLSEKIISAVRGYHRRYPLRVAMPREELRSRLKLTPAQLDALLAAAVAHAQIALTDTGARLPEFQPTLDPAQQRAVQRLLDALAATPYTPPAPELDPELLAWLSETGQIVKVADDVVFAAAAYATMVNWVKTTLQQRGSLTAAQFRDQFQTSRKYALALLEYLDEKRITRRNGDLRVLY